MNAGIASVRRWRYAALALLVFVLALVAAVPGLGQGVTPQQVTVSLPPGGSTTVAKAVETNPLPPASDFLFLADTTGSMGPSISDVKTNAQAIINAIEGAGAADGRYAVANYRDTTALAACDYLDELDTNFTNAAGAITAINTWSVGTNPGLDDGCDLPESQLYALHQATTSSLGLSWRAAAEKFIIWFGDAPGHDPICNLLPGYSDPVAAVTEASATADLVNLDAHVIAVSIVGAANQPGLDADPTLLAHSATRLRARPTRRARQGRRRGLRRRQVACCSSIRQGRASRRRSSPRSTRFLRCRSRSPRPRRAMRV